MTFNNSILSILLLSCLLSCQHSSNPTKQVPSDNNAIGTDTKHSRSLAKFEPKDNRCLVFAGQELEAIGGLDAPYNDGYLDHYKRPAGFTMYSNLSVGDTSFGYVQKGLDGIFSTDDWGDSPSNMSLQLADPDFENMALAIGLSMVNHEENVAQGKVDHLIKRMGEFFLSLGDRPVFLRIGYEFDGHSWNHYDLDNYKIAYKRIKDKLDDMGVNNVAYVWQSTGWVSDQYMLEEWYPGDEYVDWCATSFFARWSEIEMFEFARKKGKPVFIAEATPTISDHTIKFDGDTKELILSNQEQAEMAWARWFEPFFQTIEENKDIIKAISYINCHWNSHVMWEDNPTFRDVDARLQSNEWLSKKWKEKIYSDAFIHSSELLYDKLK